MREEINLVILLLFDFQILKTSNDKNIPKEKLIDSIFTVFKSKSHLCEVHEYKYAAEKYNVSLRNDLYVCLCTPLIGMKKYTEAIRSHENGIRIIYNTLINDELYLTNPEYLNLNKRILNYKEN